MLDFQTFSLSKGGRFDSDRFPYSGCIYSLTSDHSPFGRESIQIFFAELKLSFSTDPAKYQIWLKEATRVKSGETRPDFWKQNSNSSRNQDGGDGVGCIFVSFVCLHPRRSLCLCPCFVSAWNPPRLVTLVVRVVQVVDVHLELKTEGNIVPSESE